LFLWPSLLVWCARTEGLTVGDSDFCVWGLMVRASKIEPSSVVVFFVCGHQPTRRRKTSLLFLPRKEDSHGVHAWVLNTQGRVLNTRKPCHDSLGNPVNPNVRVTVAVENRDGIDGHRHTLPSRRGVSRHLAPVHEAWLCLIILRQGADVLHRGRPSQTRVHAIRVSARIIFRVTGTLRSGFCRIQRARTVFFLSVRTFFSFLNS